jgi:hypothetical protein
MASSITILSPRDSESFDTTLKKSTALLRSLGFQIRTAAQISDGKGRRTAMILLDETNSLATGVQLLRAANFDVE